MSQVNWIRIQNKFKATCLGCSESIAPGESVKWSKGIGVLHTTCEYDPNKLKTYDRGYVSEDTKPKSGTMIWKNPQKYNWADLQTIIECQRCGIKLSTTGDGFYEGERKVCQRCFGCSDNPP